MADAVNGPIVPRPGGAPGGTAERGRPTRRQLVLGLAGAVAALQTGAVAAPARASAAGPAAALATGPAAVPDISAWRTALEAFADTMVPGEKRHSGDRAVAGAAAGPGAVQAGTVELLCLPELGLAPLLPVLAELLDTRAVAYALRKGRVLLPVVGSAFAGLGFRDRTALAAELLEPGAADQKLWVLLALFSSLAFDTAAHLHTTDAVAQRHPGLAWSAFPPPDADGLWRFPESGYGRELARTHPRTTSGGHPA
ncbi:DUF5987 family protein [Streptomyces sp. S07_1.15]|uniref:DUF5987 family protein n=1 Tax=Streptomyces sp. S07_1.15 TaxID=2873925 RepID=UPI001D14715A|nr:DUF5987 family protein [Streptomyces sp. S07_1.15]MCC3653362.1 DUF5987 family protein [Streptomyces sp. S07_1.15]